MNHEIEIEETSIVCFFSILDRCLYGDRNREGNRNRERERKSQLSIAVQGWKGWTRISTSQFSLGRSGRQASLSLSLSPLWQFYSQSVAARQLPYKWQHYAPSDALSASSPLLATAGGTSSCASAFNISNTYRPRVQRFGGEAERGCRRFRGSLAEANGRESTVPPSHTPPRLGIIVAFISSPPATVLTL